MMNNANYISIDDLPEVESTRFGWPWTRPDPPASESRVPEPAWPGISIVTPSFNQGGYIEETIRSVLLQGYPNLEYIIIDGGSTDNTVEIIKKYEDHLTYWVSEPDAGQSQAINNGFRRATGEIFAYINSDDLYEPEALAAMAEVFAGSAGAQLVVGECLIFDDSGEKSMFRPRRPERLDYYLTPFGSPFAQPAAFWRRELYHQVGGFDETLHYAFDREFFLKVGLAGVTPRFLNRPVARYRDHGQTKTRHTIRFFEEAIPVITRHGRACGLTARQIKDRLGRVRNDIEYLKIFQTWREEGRWPALARFVRRASIRPGFLFDRKVLGQARRLLMFREQNVAELKYDSPGGQDGGR